MKEKNNGFLSLKEEKEIPQTGEKVKAEIKFSVE